MWIDLINGQNDLCAHLRNHFLCEIQSGESWLIEWFYILNWFYGQQCGKWANQCANIYRVGQLHNRCRSPRHSGFHLRILRCESVGRYGHKDAVRIRNNKTRGASTMNNSNIGSIKTRVTFHGIWKLAFCRSSNAQCDVRTKSFHSMSPYVVSVTVLCVCLWLWIWNAVDNKRCLMRSH